MNKNAMFAATAFAFLLVPSSLFLPNIYATSVGQRVTLVSAESGAMYGAFTFGKYSSGICPHEMVASYCQYSEAVNSNLSDASTNHQDFPDTLGTSQTGSFELGGSEQRFTFSTRGRWWVFY